MKQLNVILLSLLCLLTAACSKSDNGDSMSLLRTVPADASSVVIVSIDHTVAALGGKIDGGKVKLPAEMQKALDQSQGMNPRQKTLLKDIINGESGISLSSIVYYSAARSYVSGLLDDPDKFMAFVQKQSILRGDSLDIKTESGARILGKTVVIGNQFWICTEGTPDVEQLKYTRELNERQSFAGSDAASLLLEEGKALTFVADFNRTLAKMPDASSLRMGTALVFDDMTYIAGSVNLKKDLLTAQAAVLNSDMRPAEVLIPVEKIDPAAVKSLKGAADNFLAVGISAKLVKQLSESSAAQMPGAKLVMPALSQIDGTLAVRANGNATDIEAHVQTTGKNFSDLSFLAENLLGMSVTRQGDNVTLTRGTNDFTGIITPQEAADMMKGAWLGFVSYGTLAPEVTSALRLSPHKGSLMLELEAKGGVEVLLNALF